MECENEKAPKKIHIAAVNVKDTTLRFFTKMPRFILKSYENDEKLAIFYKRQPPPLLRRRSDIKVRRGRTSCMCGIQLSIGISPDSLENLFHLRILTLKLDFLRQ